MAPNILFRNAQRRGWRIHWDRLGRECETNQHGQIACIRSNCRPYVQ
jgi:hypothetical protein